MSQDRLEYWGEKNKIGCWNIKRLTLIKENKSSQINVFSKVFNVWVDARVLAYRNHSFDMHLNYIGSVSCFSPSWIPSRYTVRNHPPPHTHTHTHTHTHWHTHANSLMSAISFVYWYESQHSLSTVHTGNLASTCSS